MAKMTHYIMTALIGTVIGSGMAKIAEYARSPVSAYVMDVNGDGIKDIVTRSATGYRTIFVGQKDGTFKQLEVATKEQKDSLDATVREIESKAK